MITALGERIIWVALFLCASIHISPCYPTFIYIKPHIHNSRVDFKEIMFVIAILGIKIRKNA